MQYEFPDENGKPYKSNGGQLVWNNELQKYIPTNWIVGSIAANHLTATIQTGVNYFNSKNYLATANVNETNITDGEWITYEDRESRANMQPIFNSIWFAKMKQSRKHITITNRDKWFIDKYILSTGFFGLQCNTYTIAFIRQFIYSELFEITKDTLSHGNTQQAVNNYDLQNIRFAEPSEDVLLKFSNTANPIINQITACIENNQNLLFFKEYILPLLMNGQVKVI